MLRGIVKYRCKRHKQDDWLLSDNGLQEVTDDFHLLNDFHFGSQQRDLEKWNKTYGEMFFGIGQLRQVIQFG
jgi:hypothetical protein